MYIAQQKRLLDRLVAPHLESVWVKALQISAGNLEQLVQLKAGSSACGGLSGAVGSVEAGSSACGGLSGAVGSVEAGSSACGGLSGAVGSVEAGSSACGGLSGLEPGIPVLLSSAPPVLLSSAPPVLLSSAPPVCYHRRYFR